MIAPFIALMHIVELPLNSPDLVGVPNVRREHIGPAVPARYGACGGTRRKWDDVCFGAQAKLATTA